MWELEFLSHNIGEYANHRYNTGIRAERNKKTIWYISKLNLWDVDKDNRFVSISSSNYCDIKTLRGFKKHLRKHDELKSCDFVELCSRIEGHGVRARWVEKDK